MEMISVGPSNTLRQRLRALGDFSQFARKLDPADRVVDVFQPQTPSSPHLDFLVQITVSSKWQHMNSHYHSTNSIPAQQGSPALVDAVGKYFIVPSEYLTNIIVVH